jgi:hypothetical protein
MSHTADNSNAQDSLRIPPVSADSQAVKAQSPEPRFHDFSIVVGGPVYGFLIRKGLVRVDLRNILHRTGALIAITWLPLLFLSILQGVAVGHRVTIPLLLDFATYGRFLLALPLFLLAEVVIDPAVQKAVEGFVGTGIVQEKEFQQFEDLLGKLRRMRDSSAAELILLALSLFPVFVFRREWTMGALSSWHTTAQGLTIAGWWYALVSAPVLRFIGYRWTFRYCIWAFLLWSVGRLNLHLLPTHPDRSAGLEFLGLTQRRFGILLCALGCTFAGHLVNGLLHEGASLDSYKILIAAFLAISLSLGLLPLTLLAPTLSRVRRAGLREYGRLGTQYAEAFDRKWVHASAPPQEPLLGTSDLRSLSDLANSYAVIRQMQIAPITKRLAVTLAVYASIPLIPAIILGTPTSELLKAVMKMLV